MRWIVLALSLGATIVSLIHGVLAVWQLASTTGGSITIGGSAFTWMTAILLLASVIIALIGAILAFNRRRIGGIFIIAAALICLLAHSSTRIYGLIYLVGGAMAFMVRSHSEYEYEYEEYDFENRDELDDDPEEREEKVFAGRSRGGKREDPQEFSYGKRKERASRIKLDREERSLSGDEIPRMSEPLRIRSSKVCPACGASVGIEHKFCYTCGGSLHASHMADDEPDDVLQPRKDPSSFRDFKMVSPVDDPEPEEEELQEEDSEEAVPHRVFVKSSKEEEEINPHPIVDPDDSYQEFSNYTRRRKRRRTSLARRILGPLILLLAVGGAAWLLLGMRRVPPPPPVVVEPIPIPGPVVVLPRPIEMLQILAPARGVVTGTTVNLRQSHSTATQVVTRLSAGARAEVIGRWEGVSGNLTGPWYNIRVENRTGWIFGQFFQALDGRQASLPTGYTDDLLNSFGSNRQELIDQLGQPANQTPTAMTWTGLTAQLRGDDVIRLQITGAQHVLENELAVGMTEEMLYRRVGYPSDLRAGQLLYIESGAGAERGMAVRLQNGRIQSITVGNI